VCVAGRVVGMEGRWQVGEVGEGPGGKGCLVVRLLGGVAGR